MDVVMGDLTFLSDGIDYICIWSPMGEPYTSENARPLAIIAVVLISDRVDFEKWKEDITGRWLRSCAEIMNADTNDMRVEPLPGGSNLN